MFINQQYAPSGQKLCSIWVQAFFIADKIWMILKQNRRFTEAPVKYSENIYLLMPFLPKPFQRQQQCQACQDHISLIAG